MLRNKSVVPMIIELLGAHGWGGADAVVLAALRLANVAVSGGDGDGTGPCRNVLAERSREHLNATAACHTQLRAMARGSLTVA